RSWGIARKPIISRADGFFAVTPFESAHDEVRPRDFLEVVDERIVHRRTAERANNWHGLRGELLRYGHAKARCDLRNQPHQHWRGKVPALRRIRVGLEPAQSEHLQASERSLWVRQAVRGLLAKSAAEAARFIAERGGVAEGVHVGLPAISPRRAA